MAPIRPPHIPPAVYQGLLALLTLILIWLWRRPRRLLRVQKLRGLRGEQAAADLLDRAGYLVLAAQHGGAFTVLVDGVPCRFPLRADYLVRRRRDGTLWLAEVKTGAVAPTLQHGPTRRQLLEYSLAFGEEVSGVLLVAPELGDVTHVAFPALRRLRAVGLWRALAFVAGLLCGAGLLQLSRLLWG